MGIATSRARRYNECLPAERVDGYAKRMAEYHAQNILRRSYDDGKPFPEWAVKAVRPAFILELIMPKATAVPNLNGRPGVAFLHVPGIRQLHIKQQGRWFYVLAQPHAPSSPQSKITEGITPDDSGMHSKLSGQPPQT